jgi:signal peptidase I
MTISYRTLPLVLREALPVALIALLVFYGLRITVAERYMVPSASMEPCLHGDPSGGDVVLVEKVSSWLGPSLEPYDLVVVRSPEPQHHHIVKRVVAIGGEKGCYVRLENGDLWLGDKPDELHRVMKDPLAARALRVSWFEYPARATSPEEVKQCLNAGPAELHADGIALPPIHDVDAATAELQRSTRRRRLDALQPRTLPDGYCGLARPVDTSWLEPDGRRGRGVGAAMVNDFGARLEVVPGSGTTALVLALELRPDTFAWIYGADGSVQFLHDGERIEELRGPKWNGQLARIEYGFLDNRFFLIVDDHIVDLRVRLEAWHGAEEGLQAHSGPPTLLYFAATGDAVRIPRLEVFRDLYWFRDPVPFRERREDEVPPGKIYLLGDNSLDSQDSRYFGPVSLTEYVGRPLMVLGPWSRQRLLRP